MPIITIMNQPFNLNFDFGVDQGDSTDQVMSFSY